MTLSEREQAELEGANASGKQPVLFAHGLWLLAGSWDGWREYFGERGYATVAPGWPDDPPSVTEARAHPEAFAGKSIGQITAHYAEAIGALTRKPAIVGHSFGGLVAQKLAGMGLGAATVAIDPAPFRGVLPLPISSLRSALPVLKYPATRNKAKALTFEQFRYGFTNAVPEDKARELYDTYHVAGPGRPLFQAAFANLNPKTEARVDFKSARRGPLLIVSGEKDHIVPWAIANASYKKQRRNAADTEITEIPGRGHSLVIDSGWREVADVVLDFLNRHEVNPE